MLREVNLQKREIKVTRKRNEMQKKTRRDKTRMHTSLNQHTKRPNKRTNGKKRMKIYCSIFLLLFFSQIFMFGIGSGGCSVFGTLLLLAYGVCALYCV